MTKNLLVLIGVTVVIGLLSMLLTYLRADRMSPEADLASKGLAAVRRGNIVFFGVFMPVLVAVIGFFIWRGLLARSPETAANSFLLLAVGAGVVLSVLAAVVFKMRGFTEFTVLHILYIAGFGWLIPLLWAR